jgi:hypothetical protein
VQKSDNGSRTALIVYIHFIDWEQSILFDYRLGFIELVDINIDVRRQLILFCFFSIIDDVT